MHHFADDTNLLFSNENPKLMETILNQELKSVLEWLCANPLSINVSKTEFIIFKPHQKPLNQTKTLNRTTGMIYKYAMIAPKVCYVHCTSAFSTHTSPMVYLYGVRAITITSQNWPYIKIKLYVQ